MSRALRLFLPVLLVLAGTGACSPSAGTPPVGSDDGRISAIRTTVEFGPEAVMVAEVLRIGEDARARVTTPEGLFGEEILLGEDHYVRMPDAAPVIGGDRWIHTDLSDPRQRRYHERNRAGLIELAELADLGLGDRFAGREVRSVDTPRDGVVAIDLVDGWTIEVTTEAVEGAETIVAPEPSQVVALADIPEVAAGGG